MRNSGFDHARSRFMQYGIALAVLGTIFTVFGLDSPFHFWPVSKNVSFTAEIFETVSIIAITFGMPFAAGLICVSIASESMTKPVERCSGTGSRLLLSGIVLAGLGLIFAGYSADILIRFGATDEQEVLFSVVQLVSRVWGQFGMPLAAGFICLSIVLTHRFRLINEKQNGVVGVKPDPS
jgi:hypothetical protein